MGLSALSGLSGLSAICGGGKDTLANVPFTIRLQTYLPGSTTPIGLYQDTSCLVPATSEGHIVSAWRDEISSSGAILLQDTSFKAGTLTFENGVPEIYFDDADDGMQSGIYVGMPYAISLRERPNGGSNIRTLCGDTVGINALMSAGRNNENNFFLTATVSNQAGAQLSPNILTMTCDSSNGAFAYIGGIDFSIAHPVSDFGLMAIGSALVGTEPPSTYMSSLMVYPPAYRARVEHYLNSL